MCSRLFLVQDGVSTTFRKLDTRVRGELLVQREGNFAICKVKEFQKDTKKIFSRLVADMIHEGGEEIVDNKVVLEFRKSEYVVVRLVPKLKGFVEVRSCMPDSQPIVNN